MVEFINKKSNKFKDDFKDICLQSNLIQRKLAPESVAISTIERVKLIKSDHLQKTVDKTNAEVLTVDFQNE